MINTLILSLGNPSDCLVSTAVIKRLKDHDHKISIMTKDKKTASVYKFNNKIDEVYLKDKLPNKFPNIKFDKVISFYPEVKDILENTNYDQLLGFDTNEDSYKYYDILYRNRKTKMNIFQIFFRLAGEIWRGECIDFYYRPRTKSKRNRVGIAVANSNLKEYVINELELEDEQRIWYIPRRNNILKQCDELNKCKKIVTDDFQTMLLSVALRKDIYFLKTIPYNFKIEMFNRGKLFKVPRSIIR